MRAAESGQSGRVAVDDLPRSDLFFYFNEFVTGGDDSYARFAVDGDKALLQRGQHRNFAGPKHLSGCQHGRIGAHIFPAHANVCAPFFDFENGDVISLALCILDGYDGVGAGRNNGSGHYAAGLSRAKFALRHAAGGNVFYDL